MQSLSHNSSVLYTVRKCGSLKHTEMKGRLSPVPQRASEAKNTQLKNTQPAAKECKHESTGVLLCESEIPTKGYNHLHFHSTALPDFALYYTYHLSYHVLYVTITL